MSVFDDVKKILQGIGSGVGNGVNDVVGAFQRIDRISKNLQAGRPADYIQPGIIQAATPIPSQQPTPSLLPTPISTPGTQPGFNIPNVPNNIAQLIGQVMANQGIPMDATASAQILNHPYGPQIKGYGRGENPNFQTILDVPNRIDANGNWSDTAPITQITNPNTGQLENSNDRGLWRINNATFYDYQRRFPEIFKQYNINSYEDMNDPLKNTIVGKLIIQHQGGAAYFAAPANMANFGKIP